MINDAGSREELFLQLHKKKYLKLFIAYIATYFIWGSTPFVISVVVKEIPPLYSSAIRYFIAGMLIVGWSLFKHKTFPEWKEWINIFITAFLLLAVSNASTCWSCQYLPSSIVAVIQSLIPLFMILLDVMYFHFEKLTVLKIISVVCGAVGVLIIVMSKKNTSDSLYLDTYGVLIVIAGSFSWALGSMLLKIFPYSQSGIFSTGIAMLISAPIQAIAGFLIGETFAKSGNISALPIIGMLYLVIFGSIIAFSSYCWLIAVEPPSRVGSISFINPLIAMWIGVTLGNEILNTQIVIGTSIILSVVFILWVQKIKIYSVLKGEN